MKTICGTVLLYQRICLCCTGCIYPDSVDMITYGEEEEEKEGIVVV